MNMNIELLTEAEIATLRENITNANRIVICCHKSPDGDALGSSLAWAEYLRTQGKDPEIIVPDAYPDFLQWLPGSERIIRYDKHAADKADALLKEAELIFCLDFNGTDRVDEMRDALEQSPASKIMIDHHLDPPLNEMKVAHVAARDCEIRGVKIVEHIELLAHKVSAQTYSPRTEVTTT